MKTTVLLIALALATIAISLFDVRQRVKALEARQTQVENAALKALELDGNHKSLKSFASQLLQENNRLRKGEAK